jgi:hypothetical protein|nr:Gldg family protein [Kofleriaceae bacterium]
MRTASPWWASLSALGGLVLIFVSERLFDGIDFLRYLSTGLGVGLVIAVTGMRLWTASATTGARRQVERALLACQLGILFGLLLYGLSTEWGSHHIIGSMTEEGADHFHTALTVVFAVVLAASAIPLLMIELSLGAALRDNFDIKGGGEDEGVELFRVREIGWSGLTVALAMGLLMVTCQVSSERNVQKDVSYFKTSAPGDSTISIVSLAPEPIRVLLWFPDSNSEVEQQIRDYFDALNSATDKLVIEDHDAVKELDLAGKYKVAMNLSSTDNKNQKAYAVLVRGKDDKEKSQTIDIETDIEKARKGQSKLRNFDREVNTALLKLVRDKRKAYLTVGHGEMNDQESVSPDMREKVPERHVTVLKKRLAELNYEVKDLGLIDLVKDVPDDATIVFVLAPTQSLQDAEWGALDRYLDRGGRLLIAMDPKGDAGGFGPLEGKLGIKFDPAPLTDDKVYLPQHQTNRDHRFVVTTQFSAHASTTALSRAVDKGLVLVEAGALEDAPLTTKGAQPKKTYTIKSMETSFLDFNDNYEFDADGPKPEKRQKYNIAAAIEGPKLGKDDNGKDKDGYRVLAFADVDLFADVFVRNQMGGAGVTMVSGPLLEDSVRWLGGEEVFAGEIVSEDDKPIQHTKNQDAVWFGLTLIGAPALVLTLGLIGTASIRKRRRNRGTAAQKEKAKS